MTGLRHHTWGHDPHRPRVLSPARRQHIFGKVLPMEQPRQPFWKRIFGR